jgi:hypothetical protein
MKLRVQHLGGLLGGLLLAGVCLTAGADTAETKRVQLGKNVFFETQGDERRVVINAWVCLDKGPLEHLMTRKGQKEHEAILAADVDAREVQAALLAAGAKPGSPVQYQPKFVAPSGSRIRITLRYEDNGKAKIVPAQQWVRNARTRKDLDVDWVFAGSRFIDNPLDPKAKPYYLANDGDLICVANFEGALLDLPIDSTKDNANLAFEVNTDRVPARDTKVTVILEVMPEKK